MDIRFKPRLRQDQRFISKLGAVKPKIPSRILGIFISMTAKKNHWRFLSDPPMSAAMNMAIDEAIACSFHETKIPTLRLYTWASPALSIGSFQMMSADWSSSLQDNKIPIVRRITGGRALLHDQEITYSIVADTNHPLFLGGIKKTYYAVAAGLLTGLSRLGVSAEIFVPRKKTPAEQNPFCMTSLSWYEIAVSGKKLIGSAQKRWVSHFLQHGSLPLTPSPYEEKLDCKIPLHLCNILPSLPSCSEIKNALRLGFETTFAIQLDEQPLTPKERSMADQLMIEKYGNQDWNDKRNKKVTLA